MPNENPETFICPYCASENSLYLDPDGASRQRILTDCEICCRPIVIEVHTSRGALVSIKISAENE